VDLFRNTCVVNYETRARSKIIIKINQFAVISQRTQETRSSLTGGVLRTQKVGELKLMG